MNLLFILMMLITPMCQHHQFSTSFIYNNEVGEVSENHNFTIAIHDANKITMVMVDGDTENYLQKFVNNTLITFNGERFYFGISGNCKVWVRKDFHKVIIEQQGTKTVYYNKEDKTPNYN